MRNTLASVVTVHSQSDTFGHDLKVSWPSPMPPIGFTPSLVDVVAGCDSSCSALLQLKQITSDAKMAIKNTFFMIENGWLSNGNGGMFSGFLPSKATGKWILKSVFSEKVPLVAPHAL